MNTILIYSKKSTSIQNTWHFYLYIAAIPKLCVARFYKRKCSLKLVNHFIWISYQPIRALRPNIGRMHVNVIGILAGSLSPREPARRLVRTDRYKASERIQISACWQQDLTDLLQICSDLRVSGCVSSVSSLISKIWRTVMNSGHCDWSNLKFAL
jgi:hypothetical protein